MAGGFRFFLRSTVRKARAIVNEHIDIAKKKEVARVSAQGVSRVVRAATGPADAKE
jgi:hypothetical protein